MSPIVESTRSRAARPVALAALLLCAGLGAAPSRPTSTNGDVVVAVAEMGSGAPIQGAQVRIPALRMRRNTNWLGEVRFRDVPEGTWQVRVRRAGYAPADAQVVVGRKTVGPVFMLEKLPAPRDTVVNSGEGPFSRR